MSVCSIVSPVSVLIHVLVFLWQGGPHLLMEVGRGESLGEWGLIGTFGDDENDTNRISCVAMEPTELYFISRQVVCVCRCGLGAWSVGVLVYLPIHFFPLFCLFRFSVYFFSLAMSGFFGIRQRKPARGNKRPADNCGSAMAYCILRAGKFPQRPPRLSRRLRKLICAVWL